MICGKRCVPPVAGRHLILQTLGVESISKHECGNRSEVYVAITSTIFEGLNQGIFAVLCSGLRGF